MPAYEFEAEGADAIWQQALAKCDETASGCKLWSGALNTNGKAYITTSGKGKGRKTYVLERLALQRAGRPLASTEILRRTCDGVQCLEASHMENIPRPRATDEEIWAKLCETSVRQVPVDGQAVGCLLWTRQLVHGYGVTCVDAQKVPVHRMSLMIKMGAREFPLDDQGRQQVTRHLCKCKNCFEPSHLELGTYDENNKADKERDGTLRRGENHGSSVITEAVAQAIKSSWRPRGAENYSTGPERAAAHGTTKAVVASIDAGRRWAHLPGPPELIEKIRGGKGAKRRVVAIPRLADISSDVMRQLALKVAGRATVASSVNKWTGTACLEWSGYKHQGYGRLSYLGKCLFAHFVICHATHGLPPQGHVAAHECGNKTCVEAAHLSWKTHRENALDAIKHGDLDIASSTAAKMENKRKRLCDEGDGVKI